MKKIKNSKFRPFIIGIITFSLVLGTYQETYAKFIGQEDQGTIMIVPNLEGGKCTRYYQAQNYFFWIPIGDPYTAEEEVNC